MTLLCCVLMLCPEHLLLASCGVRLLLSRAVCCGLFLPLVCRGRSVALTQSPVVTACPILKHSWRVRPSHCSLPMMLLERWV